MRHLFGAALLVCSLAVFAQDAPKTEIFAGYSYGNYELIPGSPSNVVGTSTISGASSARLGLSGWNAAVAVNMNRWFSFATDFSGYYSGSAASTTTTETFTPCSGCGTQTNTVVSTVASPKVHNFLFGPQFSYPKGKVRPFAHFLVGGEHVDFTRSVSISSSSGIVTLPPLQSGHVSVTGFAMALGGGVDYSIKRRLSWRLQADYLTSQADLAQNHVRVSTGLVWRVGE
jgi:hypothetical protein